MIAVACSLSNSYLIFFDHLIKSILKHNPKFDKDFLIFCRDVPADNKYSLSSDSREHIKSLYGNVKFIGIDVEKYDKYQKKDVIYYSIETFAQRDYNQVIFWGADMLCMKPLDEMFEYAGRINGVAMPPSYDCLLNPRNGVF